MPTQTEEQRERAMRRSLVLARVGIGAWAVVAVIAVVLAFLLQPWWLWAVLAAFGALRIVMDVQRMLRVRAALSELAEE